ncbi:MAG: ABC transporter substrate-binding protein [Alphaproteobacteria bacterium]|nr:ABC transporter substrate-binding protein [Alphaproteobacteria bacterium]
MKLLPLLACLFLAISPAHAEGLAMHGKPLEPAGFTHFRYANPNAPKGGHLRQAYTGTFNTLNPFTLKGKPAQGLGQVYDKLMARNWNEPFTLYPLIAESFKTNDKRDEITFTLDKRARFHDGTPILADDILFSWETLRDHGRPNMRNVYKRVAKVEKKNDRTIRFVLGPEYDRETIMILAMMPILSKKDWKGKTFDDTTFTAPLGSGPYRVKTVDKGRSITYEHVPDYWAADLPANKGQYNFDQITFDYFRDDIIAFEAFKKGQLDFRKETDVSQWALAYNFPRLQKGDVVKETIPHSRTERFRAFFFNTRRPLFDDIKVREALSLAFDFDWVNKSILHSKQKQIQSVFPNSDLSRQVSEATKLDARTKLKHANDLLEEAGYGIKNGKRNLSFEILVTTPEDQKIALQYAIMLKKLGVTAKVRSMDAAAFRTRVNDYDYDMLLYQVTSSLSPGTEQMIYWSCQSATETGRFNFAGICDKQVDELAAAIPQTKTRTELIEKTAALDDLLMSGHYFIPLDYTGADWVAYDKKIKRPDFTPLYGFSIESWWQQ